MKLSQRPWNASTRSSKNFVFVLAPWFDKFPDRRRGHRPCLVGDFDSAFEYRHSRNGGDAILSAEARELFRVHFCHNEIARRFIRDFDHFGRDHFARTAPGRPEIHQDRQSGATRQRIETQIALDIDGLPRRRQFVLTLTATEGLPKPFILQPVSLSAVRTRQEQAALVRFHRVHIQASWREARSRVIVFLEQIKIRI
jgi:hypothetical protein